MAETELNLLPSAFAGSRPPPGQAPANKRNSEPPHVGCSERGARWLIAPPPHPLAGLAVRGWGTEIEVQAGRRHLRRHPEAARAGVASSPCAFWQLQGYGSSFTP